MQNKKAAVAALRTCSTREELEAELKRFEVFDDKETVEYLNAAMYDPQTHFTPPNPTIEEEKELTFQIFLTGTWRSMKPCCPYGMQIQ
jgi:hypothetical protein